MTIDKEINLVLRLLVCADQDFNESCKGCPYGNGEEPVSGCKTKLYHDIMRAMTTPATDDIKEKTAEDLTSEILIGMGVPMSNLGYAYLKEAIQYAIENPSAINHVVYELYPNVGKVFDVSGPAVERAIRHSVNSAIKRLGFSHVARTIGLPTEPNRTLRTSEVVAAIAEAVRRKIGG